MANGSGARMFLLMSMPLALALPAAAQTAAPKPDTTVDASRGGITVASGPNSLSIGARMQFRWTLDARDEGDADTAGLGVGEEDGALSSFDVPRLRLSLSGGVYRPWLRYAFQFEMSRAGGAGGSRIKDAVIEIRPAGRGYRLQAGQFKVPFGLQQLTSSGRQQFVERAITDSRFTPSRDMGVMLSGTAGGTTFGYNVGVFNGSGESLTQNNTGHLVAARAFVNPLGAYTLSESALGSSTSPVLHLGVGVRTGKQARGRSAAGVVEEPDNQTALNGEFAYRQGRFYSTAEYFWMIEEQRNPVAGPDLDSRGYHVQAGYMLRPQTTELGIRIAAVDGNTDVDDAGIREIRGVFGYFWRDHNLKLQADAGQVRFNSRYGSLSARARAGLPSLGTRLETGRAFSDTQVRVQMQIGF